MHRHVLLIMPHPDDETLACGGTMALYARDGVPVTYACGTRGELGRNMGRPLIATRESLPALREQELREACRILGADLRFLGLRDKTIEFVDPVELTARVKAVIEAIQPTLVITYHPQHGVHPDHNALGAAVVRAVAEIEPEKRPALHTRAFGQKLDELGEPDVVIDVSAVMAIKMEAIKAHASQTAVMLARAEADPQFRAQMEQQRSVEKYWIYKI